MKPPRLSRVAAPASRRPSSHSVRNWRGWRPQRSTTARGPSGVAGPIRQSPAMGRLRAPPRRSLARTNGALSRRCWSTDVGGPRLRPCSTGCADGPARHAHRAFSEEPERMLCLLFACSRVVGQKHPKVQRAGRQSAGLIWRTSPLARRSARAGSAAAVLPERHRPGNTFIKSCHPQPVVRAGVAPSCRK